VIKVGQLLPDRQTRTLISSPMEHPPQDFLAELQTALWSGRCLCTRPTEVPRPQGGQLLWWNSGVRFFIYVRNQLLDALLSPRGEPAEGSGVKKQEQTEGKRKKRGAWRMANALQKHQTYSRLLTPFFYFSMRCGITASYILPVETRWVTASMSGDMCRSPSSGATTVRTSACTASSAAVVLAGRWCSSAST